jgi:hypothetical protein
MLGEIASLDAASLHIPDVLQATEKSVKPWRPRLLSFASAGYGERRAEEATSHGPDESAPIHHSIT